MNWLLWGGLIVATWRVTRLLVKDEFPPAKMLRDWITSSLNPSGLPYGSEDWTISGGLILGLVGAVLGLVVGLASFAASGDPWVVFSADLAALALWIAAIAVGPVRAKLTFSIAYVWDCAWCMSFWVAVGLWWLAVGLGFSVPLPWILVAAASGFSGLMGHWDARADQQWEIAER